MAGPVIRALATGALSALLASAALAETPPPPPASNAAQAAAAALGAPGRPQVIIAGDSTAAEYGPERYPQMGWGQFLKCSLDGRVDVVNAARGGRSIKSFVAEGLFSDMLKQVRPGDTVLIQFGHNDAAIGRPDRYTDPEGDYRELLRAYVAMVRARRAVPVLITPVARRNWKGGRVQDSLPRYSAAVRAVAAETRTPLIDLAASSMALVQQIGEEPSKRYFMHLTPADGVARFPQGVTDDTHFSEIGARAIAALVADGIRASGAPVAAHLRTDRAAGPPPVLGGPSCP
jgi:lysophospholipase L1-like esterase